MSASRHRWQDIRKCFFVCLFLTITLSIVSRCLDVSLKQVQNLCFQKILLWSIFNPKERQCPRLLAPVGAPLTKLEPERRSDISLQMISHIFLKIVYEVFISDLLSPDCTCVHVRRTFTVCDFIYYQVYFYFIFDYSYTFLTLQECEATPVTWPRLSYALSPLGCSAGLM